ncbi:hypothetical protein G7Y89_g11307 [Cudoniella acicularis]|uniref:DUF1996 domain-containing protein n=1 Tax=Cudoniella acicularis TaxID=354080 RepID=A0A8H4W084_9HELO|nr:hypothetical protein G7Y89_g11307 [Cudoniella acicularis]
MVWPALALVALLAQYASAQTGSAKGSDFLRFGCSQLVIQRTDPLVNPGAIPSSHMHQVVGGSSFNATMDSSMVDPSTASKCTSCKMTEDFSNYWTASIYFQSPENGTSSEFHRWRTGFRMLTGDPMLRAKQSGSLAICHRCLAKNERMSGGSGAPCSSKDTAEFPKTPCPGGIRATVIFPSCWDGKNLDSPDHKSHVAYAPGAALAGDKCPSTHPVRIPQVMYEIMYDTSGFADPAYYKNGKQPLVYSFGDPTGYGAHGDYLFGWKEGALQRAMDALGKDCFSETCPVLKLQSGDDAIKCTKSQQAVENTGTDTWLKELPGGMAVQ